MKEKKLLTIEEIEAQTALELPDRPLMQVVPQVKTVTLVLSLMNLTLRCTSVVNDLILGLVHGKKAVSLADLVESLKSPNNRIGRAARTRS